MGAIIIGILLFMILVILHELGHFIAAKKSGAKVLEFGIGIPPKAKTLFKDKSGTEYTLNWLPLGGFVRLKGEDPTNPSDLNDKDSFLSKNIVKKLIILVAGVTMNFLIAWFLFAFAFFKGIQPIHVIPENVVSIDSQSYIMPTKDFLDKQGFLSGELKGVPVEVQRVIPDSKAKKVGIQTGDIITKLNGQKVNSLTLSPQLKKNIGEKVNISYKREEKTYTGSFQCPEDNCLLGIVLPQGGNIEVKDIKFGFLGAVGAGLHEIKAQTLLTFNALGNLGQKLVSFDKEKIQKGVEKLSGPVGAVKVGDMILTNFGIMEFLAFGGMISLALAIFNILPLPALDGGRALSVLVQSTFKLRPEKYFIVENYINVLFFVLLMSLGVYIILLDLSRFWGVNVPGFS